MLYYSARPQTPGSFRLLYLSNPTNRGSSAQILFAGKTANEPGNERIVGRLRENSLYAQSP